MEDDGRYPRPWWISGFGLVEVEVDEPLFRSEWDPRVFRLAMGAMLSGHLGGKRRHAVERIDL
jgi:hypothetical protein